MDKRDVFKVADLAERYHLPGLFTKIVNFAKNIRFASDEVMEMFCLAEEFQIFKELSEALKENIADFLVTIIQTPEDLNDYNKEFLGKCNEERNIGLRMLALIDHCKLVYVDREEGAIPRQVISHIRHIDRCLQPREHLEQLRDIIERHDTVTGDAWMDQELANLRELIAERGNKDHRNFVIESLKRCSVLDVIKAAEKGLPLTVETLVEDIYTLGMSTKLHLEMLDLTIGSYLCWAKQLEDIWNVLEKSIPEVQAIMLSLSE